MYLNPRPRTSGLCDHWCRHQVTVADFGVSVSCCCITFQAKRRLPKRKLSLRESYTRKDEKLSFVLLVIPVADDGQLLNTSLNRS